MITATEIVPDISYYILQCVSVVRWPSSINLYKLFLSVSLPLHLENFLSIYLFSLSLHCLFVTLSLCLVTFVVSLPLHLSVLLARKAPLYLANCLSHQLILFIYICLFVCCSICLLLYHVIGVPLHLLL